MSKKDKAHVAIIHLSIEIYDFEDGTGKIRETSGKNLSPKEFKDFNIKPKQLIEVRGENLHDCIFKLQKKLEDFKKK